MALSSLPTQQLLEEVVKLSQVQEMKVAVNVSVQCGLIVGGITTLSALLAGPVGIAVGGLLGTGIATYMGKGKFKSVPEILYNDLTNEQQENLACAFRNVLTPQNILTMAHLIIALQRNDELIKIVLTTLSSFLCNEMRMTIL